MTNGNLQPPCVPVSNVPTTISMFFVDKLMPTNFTGVPYGYGMINGVNLAIKAGHLDSTGKPAAGSGIFNPGGLTPPQIDVRSGPDPQLHQENASGGRPVRRTGLLRGAAVR